MYIASKKTTIYKINSVLTVIGFYYIAKVDKFRGLIMIVEFHYDLSLNQSIKHLQ
jgi:hypothetical protein